MEDLQETQPVLTVRGGFLKSPETTCRSDSRIRISDTD